MIMEIKQRLSSVLGFSHTCVRKQAKYFSFSHLNSNKGFESAYIDLKIQFKM